MHPKTVTPDYKTGKLAVKGKSGETGNKATEVDSHENYLDFCLTNGILGKRKNMSYCYELL